MILVSGINKSYGSQALFEDASFTINRRERVGLVGRNGHGKSTLFKVILGQEEIDSGSISLPKDYTLGHLSQHLHFTAANVLAECCLSLPVHEGDWQEVYKAEAMLAGLGFANSDLERSPTALSGGFQIRLNLAKLLLSEPNLLLLDEPTNYLDIVSVRWLSRFLQSWEGELMLITHDREFMDTVCTHTIGIHRNKIKKVEGSTSKLYSLIAEEEELYEKTRLGEEKRRKASERFVERFRAQASRARAVQSRIKQLEKIETKEKLAEISNLEFEFRYAPFPGKWPLVAENLCFGFSDNDKPILSDFSLTVGKGDRIGIIGPNGRGKTTLLNLLAEELRPKSGNLVVNANTKLAYFGQTNIDRLNSKNTVEKEISVVDPDKHRTIVRSICGAMMFEGDAALKNISVLSGGERSRVMLGKLLMMPTNLLLLDEPTNHLDMYSIDSLLDAIDGFEGAVLLVTHSELILHRLATRLVVFDRGEVSLFEGTYQDFLDRLGWGAEDDDPDVGPSRSRAAKSKKESRKDRAEIQKLLAPLKKKVSRLEQQIMEEEDRISSLKALILDGSSAGDYAKTAELAQQLNKLEKSVSELFNDLADATKKLESEELALQGE